MMISPILKGMSVDDLNQRYRTTYVMYDNKPTYIREFADAGRSFYFTNQGVADGHGPFDYRKLNVQRPRSRWYISKAPQFSFYLTYPAKKQFHRGLCDGNTILYNLAKRPVGWARYEPILTQGYSAVNVTPIKVGEIGIYKDHFICWKVQGEEKLSVFYKGILVAQLDPEEGVVFLLQKRFKQEVLEMFDRSNELVFKEDSIREYRPVHADGDEEEEDNDEGIARGPVLTIYGEPANLANVRGNRVLYVERERFGNGWDHRTWAYKVAVAEAWYEQLSRGVF